jgi:hypothetical protein
MPIPQSKDIATSLIPILLLIISSGIKVSSTLSLLNESHRVNIRYPTMPEVELAQKI